MDVDMWLKLVAFIVLLALSAFFSSAESAYFSLSRSVLDKLMETADPRGKRVIKLLRDPRKLLTVILTGNTIVNTAAAAIAAIIAMDVAIIIRVNPNLAVAIEVVIVTILILFLSELTPKLLALRDAETWSLKASGPLLFFSFVLSPISLPVSLFAASVSHALGIEKHDVLTMSEDEIRALVKVGHEVGALELEERKMIHSIFEFGDTTAREVMVPRIDMVVVNRDTPLTDIIGLIISRGHSRIPVYENKIDNIIGVLYAKDLLSVVHNGSDFNLMKVLRSAYFIPEEKKIDDLLKEFQRDKIHIAVVVDEYGGTAGLVTLEDIIEEIVGEIQDEYDKEQPLFTRVDEKIVNASGRIAISEINEVLEFELISENDNYDTLGGFVYSQLGEVPHKGQEFEYESYKFIVEEVLNKRIKKVKIIKEGGVFEDE